VLQLDVPIVFFVSDETGAYILEKREAYGHRDKTLVVRRDYERLPLTDRNPDIQTCLDERDVDLGGAFRNGAAFHTLTWNKIYLVEEVVAANPFCTEYFGWIDFGLYRVVEDYLPDTLDEAFFTPPTRKVHLMELQWTSDRELEDIRAFSNTLPFKIAGGFWTGHVSALEPFIKGFKACLHELLSQRIVLLEEVIFSILYNRHQELFSPFYGNYYHLLINYRKTTVVCEWMFQNIEHCIRHRCWEHVDDVCTKLYREAYHHMSPEQRFVLFDRWSYSSYYFDRERSGRRVAEWLARLESDPEQLAFVEEHRPRILKNLSYYDESDLFTRKLLSLLDPASRGD
jgi:hypothetical protein